MPASRDRSRTCSGFTGRPSARFVPPATISSERPSAAAQATISAVSRASDGCRVDIDSLRSETRKIGKAELAGMDMHAAELRAAAELREHFSRVEKALRVEGAFQALLLVEVELGEHGPHEIALLDSNAVLARQHAAHLDAEPQNVGAERFRPVQLSGPVGVVEDQRMQVAVASVKNVGAA